MNKRSGRKKRIIGTLLMTLGAVSVLVAAGGKGVVSADEFSISGGDILLGDAAYGQAKCIVGQKLMAKNPDGESTTFSYSISAVDGAPLPGGISNFTLKGNESRDLTFSFTEKGSYIYKLTCTGYDSGEYKKDTTEYTIKAFVYRDNGKGTTDIIITDATGNKSEEAAFKHVKLDENHKPEVDPLIAVDPPVQKRITGTPAGRDEFKFRLRAEESGNPMPEGSIDGEKVMSIVGEGVEEFGTWEYTVTGTYNYDISEINTGNSDYRYDTKMFTITDVVTLENGEFNVDRTIIDSNGKRVASTLITPSSEDGSPVNLEFTNVYTGGSENPTESQDPNGGGDPTYSGDPGSRGDGDNPGGSDGGEDADGGYSGSKKDRLSRVNTGDRNRIILFSILGASAGGIIIIVLVARKKKYKEE